MVLRVSPVKAALWARALDTDATIKAPIVAVQRTPERDLAICMDFEGLRER
jgi:hypothetical protein